MVAVISGNGLGLGNTSLTQLGQSQGGSPSLGQAANNSYVNAATGNLVLQSNDEGLLFDGLPLNVLRTYNSLGQLNGNDGWTYGFNRNVNGLTGTLNTAGSTITRTDDDGSSVIYTYNATLGAYQSTDQSGAIDTLSWNATSSIWTYTNAAANTQETYNATGQLTALTDTGSGASYSFSYSNGQLSQIVAGDGDTLIFGYNTNNQLISLSIQEVPPGQSAAVTRQAVSYAYDSQGRLTSVTTTLASDTDSATTASYTTTYAYQGTTDLVSSVTQSDGTTISYSYTQDTQGAYQVTGITTGTGSAAQTLILSYGTNVTTVTDGLGNATHYQTNVQGQLTAVIAPAVNGASPTTTYTYDSNGNLLTRTDPNGAATSYAYDANGNLLSVEDGAGNTVSYTYNANDQVTSKTTYTVSAQGEVGQSGYVAPSGAETTYYVYNATNQLAYTIDPLGNVSENDYATVNGLSELTTTRQYLGATYDLSSASPSNLPTLASLQAWVASSAVQATLSQSTRTDFTYDVRGQLATQTQYDTVDANGNGVLTNGTVSTATTYDAQGRLLQTSTQGHSTNYIYDGLGRLIGKIGPDLVRGFVRTVTSYVYTDNGSNDTLVIALGNGLTTTQVRNSAGLLVSTVQSGSVQQTSLSITSTSGSIITTAQIAYQSKTYRDNVVSGEFVTVTTAQNGVTLSTVSYAIPLTVAQMAQLQASPTMATLQSLLTSSSNDQIELSIYASDGQLQAHVFATPGDIAGATGEIVTLYSAYGAVQYATPLTVAQVAALGSAPTLAALQALLTTSPNDQTSFSVQESTSSGTTQAKVLPSSQTAGEYVVTLSYANSNGQTTSSTAYATPLTAAQVASLGSSPTVAQIQALVTPSASDQTTLYAYDSNGNVVAEVDYLSTALPNGQYSPLATGEYITLTQYNSAKQKTGYTTYATPLTQAQVASLGTAPSAAQIQALVTTNANDCMGSWLYDSQGQLQAVIAPGYTTTTPNKIGYFVTLYNSGGNPPQIAYGTPLTAAQVASLGSAPTVAQIQALLTPSSSDQFSLSVYDGGTLQRVQFNYQTVPITGGSATTWSFVVTTYNSNGQVVETRQYADLPSPAQIEALGSSPTVAQLLSIATPSVNDQISLNIYDASGKLAATMSKQGLSFDNPEGTPYVSNDGHPRVIWGEFLTVNGADGIPVLYKTPLTTAQISALVDAPTMSTVASIVSALGQPRTTAYVYNASGEPIVTIDPAGNASYTFYNADGEVTGTVDGDGNVTAYAYDADGQVIQTTQYATPIDTSAWLSGGALTSSYPSGLPTPSSSANDRITTSLYNASGQVVATIDPTGNVTTTTYDGTGNALSTTQYATPLTSAQRSALGSHPTLSALQADLGNNVNDRTTLTIYDADGRATATIDAKGSVTVTTYNNAGEPVRRTAYAAALTSAQLSSLGDMPTLAAVQLDLTTSVQDQTTHTYYDDVGRVAAQIDADGYLSTMAYNLSGSGTTTVITRYATALAVNQLSMLTGTETVTTLVGLLGTNTANEQSSVAYNPEGEVASRTATDGTVTTYNYRYGGSRMYNALGEVLSTTVTPASGQGAVRTTSATYDAFGDTLTSTDAAGATTAYIYNALGQPIEATDANGNSTWSYYDADGKLLYTIQGQPSAGTPNVQGNVTAYMYNAFGEVVSTTTYASALTLTTGSSSGTTLNPTGATVAQVAAAVAALAAVSGDANSVTTTTYTANGQVATITDGNGYQTVNTYDAFGDLVSVTDGLGNTTTYTYDARGEQVSETDGVGSPVTRTVSEIYDAFGRVTSRTDGNGNTITYSYDNLDRQIGSSQVVQGATRTTQATYDAFGNVLTQTDALGNVTTHSYNIATHTTVMTTPLGVATTTIKDAYGDTISVTDGAGNTTAYTYDADGRLLTTTDALGNVSTNQYDADGNLILATDANGNQVSYTYDASGWVLSKTVDPNGPKRVISYTYDGQGRELSVTDALGSVTAYTYDASGNMLSVLRDVNGLSQMTVYTYDGDGRVLTETDGAGTNEASTTQYVYDNLGRLAQSIVDPSGLNLVTSYSYDANGNRVSTTDPNGNTSFTIYNEANEAVYSINAAGSSGSGLASVTQYGYDANGNLVATRVYSNLVSTASLGSLGGAATAQALSAGAALAASAATSTDPVSYDVYNADGQAIFHIDPMGNVTEIRYNGLGQVAQTLAYATPISLNETLTAALQAGTAQASDMQDALQQGGDSDSTARTTYNYYDADGRVVYTATPNEVDGVLGAVVNETQYDAAGQVIADIVYGVPLNMMDVGAGSTTASIAQAIAQSNTAATTRITQYVYDAAGEKIAQIDPNGHASFTFYDADGRVVATVDSIGAVIQYDRDGLGRVTRKIAFTNVVTGIGLVNGRIDMSLADILSKATGSSDRFTDTSYDVIGRVASVTHYSQNNGIGNGDTLSYTYDNASRVVEAVDYDLSGNSSERVTNYFYDADGNTIATLNADGYLTTYAYDAAGQLTQATVYANKVITRSNSLGDIMPSASPNDQVTTHYYDARGNLVGTLDTEGYFTQYAYDLNDNQLTATRYATASSLGRAASFDAIVQALQGATGHQSSTIYDSYGDVVSSQDYEGTVTTRAYDNVGNLLQQTVASGTSDERTVRSDYDAFGDVVSSTDGLGNVTTYTYDLAGNKTSTTDAAGNITWYVYDSGNRLVYTIRGVEDGNGVKNALGEVFEQDYDTFSDVSQTVSYSDRIAISTGFSPTLDSMAGTVSAISGKGANRDDYIDYTYDLEGNVISKNDGNGNEFDYTYDGFNDLLLTADTAFDGLTRIYTYDGLGHMTSETDGNGTISSSTGAGEIIDPFRTQEWTYDAFGNMVTYTDGDGATTSYSYDKLDHQVAQSIEVSGEVRETDTSYDAYGRVLSSTDALGLVTTYSYDDIARSTTVTSPGGVSVTTTYNREGQKIAITDALGNTTRYHYDANGNLTQAINPDGSLASNQYDAVGNLIQTTDADGNVVEYAYDAAGRVLTKTVDPAGLKLVTSYSYDGRGLVMSMTDPVGVETDYGYDGNGNLIYKEQDAGHNDAIRSFYQYNELNEVTSSSAEGVEDYEVNYYGYDAFGHLTYQSTDTGKAQSTRYTYDADGHVSSKTDGNGNTTYYFYDEAGEQVYTVSPVGGGGSIPVVPAVARAEFTGGVPSGGAIVQTWYNADGQVVGTTAYAIALAPYQLNELANGYVSTSGLQSFVSTSDDDRSSYSFYNANGQLQYSIDATGAVTEYAYNADGQMSQTLAYANPIDTSALMDALQNGTVSPSNIQSALAAAGDSSANARITYTYYDDMGRVSFVVSLASLNGQSGGLVKQTQYDANGNIVAQIQYGNLIPLSEVGGNATTASIGQYLASDTQVQVTRSVYDAAGRKVYSIDAGNNVTETQYDADGRVTWTLQYAMPIAAPASWSAADVATAVQVANSGSTGTRGTENVYDAFGNVIETFSTASSNPTAVYSYNGRGLKTSYTDASGNTWTYDYDEYGNLTAQYSPSVDVASYSGSGEYEGVTSQSIATIYYYDSNGNLTEEIDARDSLYRDTKYTYDTAGNLIKTSYSDPGAFDTTTGQVTATGNHPEIDITYDTFGEAVVSQDANGNFAYDVYNANGRLSYAIDGDGYVTGYQYDAYGNQTVVTRYATPIDFSAIEDNTGWWTGQQLHMDEVGFGLTTSSADRTITTTYDAQGNKLSVTEPAITYTKSDGTTATGSPVTQYTYDAYGNVTSQSVLLQGTAGQADAVWATTYNYYDALGHQVMTVDPMGYVTTHAYDAFGDVTAEMQYATAISTSGLVAGGTPPALPPAGNAANTGLDRITEYTYDNNGNKTSVSIQRSYVNAQGQAMVGFDTTTYGYDANNRLTTVTENGNTITTAYDALGRISSVTGPQVEVLVSNWQALLEANPSLSLTDPSLYTLASQVVSYAYDALGNKLVQTLSSTGSTQSVSTYYQYDGAGHVVAEMTPLDGAGVNWLSSQVKYMTYDSNGNVVSQSYTLSGNDNSTATVTTVNTYDANNQQISSVTSREGIPSPDKATGTTYDAFGEVTTSGDGVTNNLATVYDNAGNKISSTDPKTGELHTYGYNLAGQLVSDTVPLAASVGGTTQMFYTLDLDGRTIAEQAPSSSASSGESSGILHATYDAWGNVLSSTDANGYVISYTYNERNDVVTETEASVTVVGVDGASSTTTPVKTSGYDIEGNVVISTDENNNVIENIYNALGQKTESIDGAGAVLYTAYDALGNSVAQQDGNGNITFTNVDALGRTVQSGEFELSGGSSRQAVWRQAYVLDQNGNRIISYDGVGSAYLQSGDTTDAALHANYDGYDSQGRVIWSQNAAQRAASTANAHGIGNYGSGSWSQNPPNADFSQGSTGWEASPGWVFGNWNYDGQNWAVQFNPSNLSNGGSGTLVSTNRVPVVPGQVITASGNTEVQSTNGWGSMEIVWYDAQGNAIGTSTDKNSPGAEQDGRRGAGTAWVTGTAPAGAAYAAIGLNAGNYNEGDPGVTFSRVWWDYTPPAYITSLGSGNGGAVVMLPSGSFTDQVTNGDFEEGNVGWTLGTGFSIDQSTSAANGNWQARYTGSGAASMVNNDRVPVVAGQSITASAQIALYLPDGASNTSGTVAINWYDANGNLISTSSGNTVYTDKRAAWKTSTVSASAPPGAAYAMLAVFANNNGVGIVGIDAARWNYQYIPQVPTGVVQDTYVYDMDGNLVSETTADGDTESWQYNQYGQVTQHTDLSGAQYSYTYDADTGAQIGESDNWSPTAQKQVAPPYVTKPLTTPNSETLTYYADGQIATETFSDGSSYSYQYDNNGNLVREEDTTVDGNNNTVHTVTQTTYDSHNRVNSVTETNEVTGAAMLSETFSYDAAGNRREVKATSNGITQYAWYTYDGDNRVEIADGALQNNQIVVTSGTGSYENAYDANGNVIKIFTRDATSGDTMAQTQVYNAQNELIETGYAVDVTQGAASNGVDETITYDANGVALVTQTFYKTGATIQSNNQTVTVSGELESATVNFYDAMGRLAESQTFNTPSGWDGTGSPIPTSTPSPEATTYGSLTLQSEVVYQGPNGTSGYDADGNVVAYQYRDGTSRVDQYQVNYLRKDTYLQGDTTGDSNTANVQPATDETIYDTRGNEVALEQHTEDPYGTIADTVHVFAYNGEGEIIEREDGTGSSGTSLNLGSDPNKEIQNYTYVNGQQLAHFDNAGTLDVLDQVTAFSSNNDSPNSYVVQAGDTLESIAQEQYGNANLWYVIAQANDLSSDTNLALGARLQIPVVTTHANSATTFKPYDPSSIVGSTSPSLPTIAPPPPPMSNHCSWLAQLISVVVTVVVTFYSRNPIAGAAAGNASGQVAQAMLNGTYDWGRFLRHTIDPFEGSHAGWGKTILGQIEPTYGGTEFWTSKSGGSDLDIAIWNPPEAGMKGQFDRQSTLIAAGVGAATWGAGEYVNSLGASAWVSAGVAGGVGYAANAGLNEAFGRPADFSLGGLAASVLGAAAGAEVGGALGENQPGIGPMSQALARTADYAVGDVVDRELSLAFGDQNVPTWSQLAGQVAGDGIGWGAIGVGAYEAQQASQRQQANEQLANKVTNQVTNDQSMLNDVIWNGASAEADTRLQNEGQVALNQAWGGAQDSINGYINGLVPNSPSDLVSGATSVASSSGMTDSTGAIGANPDVAYSGMPLNGHGGAMVDYFVAPADSMVGTEPGGSSNTTSLARVTDGVDRVVVAGSTTYIRSVNFFRNSDGTLSSTVTELTVPTENDDGSSSPGFNVAQGMPVNTTASASPASNASAASAYIPPISLDSYGISLDVAINSQPLELAPTDMLGQMTIPGNAVISPPEALPSWIGLNFAGSKTQALQQQLQDVMPGSGREKNLLQQVVIAGSTSPYPGDWTAANQASETLKRDQIASETAAFGHPLPTVGPTPDTTANDQAVLQMIAAEDGPGAMISQGYALRAHTSIQGQINAVSFGSSVQDAMTAHYTYSQAVGSLRSSGVAPEYAMRTTSASTGIVPSRGVDVKVVPNSAESASRINSGATLRDYLGDLDKNTMIHLTAFPKEAFENGIKPGAFFARYGDVAHLTPQQYRIGVVGPVAGGYGPDANLFVTVSPANSEEFFTPWESAFGYVEWQNPSKVMPDQFFSVPSGPQLPYPETVIPPPPSPHP